MARKPRAGEQYSDEWWEIRRAAEADINFFARLVHPQYQYGEIHTEVFKHLASTENPNILLLLPRAHLKSHCMAVWCEWEVTNKPDTSILYVSATTTLAEAQLGAIKRTFTSDIYSFYWPDMVNTEEGKREKWTANEICVDHPKRAEEGIRDNTIKVSGLSTTTTGLHAEVVVADDVVVPDNAYTEEGRRKVSAAMSQMASILNAGGMVKACGTRYHPSDQYSVWLDQEVPHYDEETGEYIGKRPIWSIMQREVEKNNVYLWPRVARADGKLFGFNRQELDRISAMYTDRVQFFAQYYNNPNESGSNRINRDTFQYYDPKFLKQEGGHWYFKDKKLALYAAMDFAYSLSETSDYSAIVIIGIDSDRNIFILDMDRFRTDRIADYYKHVTDLHSYWNFPRLKAEVSVAQKVIVNDLKDKIKESGGLIKIEEHRPMAKQGSKEERIAAVLEHRYEDLKMYHRKDGLTPILENELILARPKNDDLKDSLAVAVEVAKPPNNRGEGRKRTKRQYNSRFGGVSFK